MCISVPLIRRCIIHCAFHQKLKGLDIASYPAMQNMQNRCSEQRQNKTVYFSAYQAALNDLVKCGYLIMYACMQQTYSKIR